MKVSRTIAFLILLASCVGARTQSWVDSYETGLAALRAQSWSAARAAFKEATTLRKDDTNRGTTLPGPVTDRKQWRGGLPYSPNFAAAYCGLKQAFAYRDDAERTALLNVVAGEFEALIAKKQQSRETYYFLNIAYTAIGESEKVRDLETRFQKNRKKLNWKVDPDIVGPEEMAAIDELARVDATSTTGSAAAAILPDQTNPTNPTTSPRTPPKEPKTSPSDPAKADPPQRQDPTNPANPVVPKPEPRPPRTSDGIIRPGEGPEGLTPEGKVVTLPHKFALVIGNSEGRIAEAPAPPFASGDAQIVRDALVDSAGYGEDNVQMLQNATAGQIRGAAEALAARMPEGGTLFIFFAGSGVNIDGKDYLAGIDSEGATDSGTMISKDDLFAPFMSKGANIFAFFEVNRGMNSSARCFGMDVPMVGSIAQVQATVPGGSVLGVVRGGKMVGVFALAMTSVLNEYKANRVPVLEFSWQVFYRMRRGGTGGEGGGSQQTPTLPILTNIASDAKF
ncbi:MAG TPA: hypothetical protein PLL78_02885 [Fimbriimonadaceae bacterium]|nr:hypothetical protein [Fimbriimonadaceae bacterium]HRJ95606.1 hypothetical protein [Fimbriimonadaceae bacterium]